jgi:15-cis-phytoene synthase
MISKIVLNRARQITKHYGRGFYRASFLFTKETREATWILYAFVRLPDEMVDSQKDMILAKEQLDKWSLDWTRVLDGETDFICDDILFATKEVFDQYNIPYQYSFDFLRAMHQDLNKDRYETYKELEDYMYGSASVIGIMMSHIIGFSEGALPYAKSLGEAFQLINFLRDTKDDYESRGRIYLPKEDMDKFGVTEDHVKRGILDNSWRNFMSFELDRARDLLSQGLKGIPMLSGGGQKAVYASYLIYSKIVEEIKNQNYDTFSKRIVVSPITKTMLLLRSIWKKNL